MAIKQEEKARRKALIAKRKDEKPTGKFSAFEKKVVNIQTVAAYEARQELKKGFDKVIDAAKESNNKLESVKKVQELLKDQQKEIVKTEKKLLDLETNRSDISDAEYVEQKNTLNEQLDQCKSSYYLV